MIRRERTETSADAERELGGISKRKRPRRDKQSAKAAVVLEVRVKLRLCLEGAEVGRVGHSRGWRDRLRLENRAA